MNRKRKFTFITLALSFVALVVAGLTWKADTSSGTTNQEAFNQSVRNALAEINLPENNNASAINSASDNLANFIFYRSGVQLSQSNKDLLRDNEQKAWNQSKRITKEQLTQILREIATEKLANLTDAQRDGAAQALSGFYSSDLPSSFLNGAATVRLRADGRGSMPVSDFNSQTNFIRGLNARSKITQDLIYNSIAVEVEEKVNVLSKADSSFFDNSEEQMTPMQALLIAYAVVADDAVAGNQSELTQKMQNVQQGISQIKGSYPSPQGHRAFGLNGYLYSTPTDLLMDDAAINYFLNKVKEKGGLQ